MALSLNCSTTPQAVLALLLEQGCIGHGFTMFLAVLEWVVGALQHVSVPYSVSSFNIN